MRELTVLPSSEEHDGKLQPFRRVQGHEGHHTLIVVGKLIRVRDQRYAFQKRLKAPGFRLPRILLLLIVRVGQHGGHIGGEFPSDGDQLVEVIQTGAILRVVGYLQFAAVPSHVQNRRHDRPQVRQVCVFIDGGLRDKTQAVHHVHELCHGVFGAGA